MMSLVSPLCLAPGRYCHYPRTCSCQDRCDHQSKAMGTHPSSREVFQYWKTLMVYTRWICGISFPKLDMDCSCLHSLFCPSLLLLPFFQNWSSWVYHSSNFFLQKLKCSYTPHSLDGARSSGWTGVIGSGCPWPDGVRGCCKDKLGEYVRGCSSFAHSLPPAKNCPVPAIYRNWMKCWQK